MVSFSNIIMAEEIATLDLLEQKRIRVDADIPPHQFLFRWNDTPCFARGELVAVTGKAKSGKTYLCSILMALAEQEQMMCFRREDERKLRVLWIDTEQSEDSTQEILRDRIGQMTHIPPDSLDWDANYCVYNLRSVCWRERMNLVNAAILVSRADLVIFDGIRDVVGDINDYTEAQQTVETMLSLASWSKACIVCVLHQNKSAEDKTLRGALGTELQNKSFETYECSKNQDTKIFSVSQVATRKYDVYGRLEFIVDTNGLPKHCAQNDMHGGQAVADTKKEERMTLNPEFLNELGRIDKVKLMKYAFAGETFRHRDQLVRIVMRATNIQTYKFANIMINESINEGILTLIKIGDSEAIRLSTEPELGLDT